MNPTDASARGASTSGGDGRPSPSEEAAALGLRPGIRDALRPDELDAIVADLLDSLGTAAAIYEADGTCAAGRFAEPWCLRVGGKRRRAGEPGGVHDSRCYASCRDAALEAMATGADADLPGPVGARIFAVPIVADGNVVGAVAFGHDVPTELDEGDAAHDLTGLPPELPAPTYSHGLVDRARRRARAAAELIGAQVGRLRSESRLRLLVDAGSILASALDFDSALRGVVRLATDRIADMALAYTVDAEGRIRRVAFAHADPEKEPLFQDFPGFGPNELPPSLPTRVIRTGQVAFDPDVRVETLADPELEAEYFRLIEALAPRSIIMVPLLARGRIVGALALATAEGGKPRFEEGDIPLVEALGARTALAVDNARLYVEAEEALERAEAAAGRLSLLQAATAALSRAVAPEDVIGNFLERAMAALGASGAGVAALSPDGREFVLLALRGMRPEYRERFARFPVDAPYPTRDVARTRRPVFLESFAEWARSYRRDQPGEVVEPEADRAWAALPLAVADRLLGVLALQFPSPRRFSRADRDFMGALASEFAQALERSRLYEAEQDARRRAEQASLSKSQFLAVMSHELRTPLTAVIGYADLLASETSGNLNPKQAEQVGRIRSSAWHLVSIIDEILTFARMEAGREQVRFERLDATHLARAASELLEPQARARGLELHADVPPGPLWIRSDPGKVRQILLNLLGNAVKFTDEGGVFLTLHPEGDEWLAFTVRDTGPGIDAAHLERIFEPFTQADQSATRLKGGTGLGLAVSRRLAHLLGGDVTVESTVGEGSTFTLRLPMAGE
ncbi:MAG TPA: ATP-binding protein [Longimicrobiales bacterium]|nr:ATP-binding protein [Longimicrobiales bacterium]